MVHPQRQNPTPATVSAANQIVFIDDGVDPQPDMPVFCTACQSRFELDEFPREDIECLNDWLCLRDWEALIANYKEFKPLCERFPMLRELTQPTYGRPIPLPPKLSVALGERIGHALTAEDCEVLDRPANRWFPHIYWLHDLPTHIDVLIEEANRRVAEFVDQFDGKRILCRKCLKDALIVDRRIDFFDDE